jgi:hypothetical protein
MEARTAIPALIKALQDDKYVRKMEFAQDQGANVLAETATPLTLAKGQRGLFEPGPSSLRLRPFLGRLCFGWFGLARFGLWRLALARFDIRQKDVGQQPPPCKAFGAA